MAVGFDAATTSSTGSFSHTTAGSNRLLMVAISNSTITAQNTTAVTYNSVSLTEIQTRQTSGNAQVKLWYLVAPATGSNTVAITGGTSSMRAAAVSFTGVDQTAPIGNTGTDVEAGFNSSTPFVINLNTNTANSWVFAAVTGAGSLAVTDTSFSTGTERSEAAAGTGVGATATLTTTSSGAQTLQWDSALANVRPAVAIVAEMQEVQVAGGTPQRMMTGMGT